MWRNDSPHAPALHTHNGEISETSTDIDGEDRYPDDAFDEAWQPLPVVKQVLAIFDGTRTPWSLAVGFASGNRWLGGRNLSPLTR